MSNDYLNIDYIRFVVELSGINDFLEFAKEDQYHKITNAIFDLGMINELFPKTTISFGEIVKRMRKFKSIENFKVAGKKYTKYRGLFNIYNFCHFIWPEEFDYVPENISNDIIIQVIKKMIKTHTYNDKTNGVSWKALKTDYSIIYYYIFDVLYPIPLDYDIEIQTIPAYLYMLEHNMTEYPRSLVFKKYVRFHIESHEFNVFSSNYEKDHTKEGIEYINKQREKSCIEKYGKSYYPRTEITENKRKQTNLERYGVEFATQSDYFKEKIKNTNRERYGVDYPQQSKEIRKKARETNLRKRGVEYASQDPEVQKKIKQTVFDKYGVVNPSQSEEIKKKKEQTTIKHFGVKTPFESEIVQEKIKKTNIEKYNTESPMQNNKVCEKANETKRLKHSFNTSKPEEDLYKILVDIFGYEDVIRQYSSERYQFNCDFYIKSLDMFIEYQGFWSHNDHPFDPSSEDDKKILEKWESKQKQSYENAIMVWTQKDPLKRKIAKEHNLNYIELWNSEDVQNFIGELEKMISNITD